MQDQFHKHATEGSPPRTAHTCFNVLLLLSRNSQFFLNKVIHIFILHWALQIIQLILVLGNPIILGKQRWLVTLQRFYITFCHWLGLTGQFYTIKVFPLCHSFFLIYKLCVGIIAMNESIHMPWMKKNWHQIKLVVGKQN